MTQLQQAGRRTSLVTSAAVAAIAAIAITASALLIIPALSPATISPETDARFDRAVEAGQAWQRQRLMESADYHNRMHAVEQAGLEWQLVNELTNPNR